MLCVNPVWDSCCYVKISYLLKWRRDLAVEEGEGNGGGFGG